MKSAAFTGAGPTTTEAAKEAATPNVAAPLATFSKVSIIVEDAFGTEVHASVDPNAHASERTIGMVDFIVA